MVNDGGPFLLPLRQISLAPHTPFIGRYVEVLLIRKQIEVVKRHPLPDLSHHSARFVLVPAGQNQKRNMFIPESVDSFLHVKNDPDEQKAEYSRGKIGSSRRPDELDRKSDGQDRQESIHSVEKK